MNIISESAQSTQTERASITRSHFRDNFILAKALAYAIEAIESLPKNRQEWSDCQDMKAILVALFDDSLIGIVTYDARHHLHAA
jgi:hypothetical protein